MKKFLLLAIAVLLSGCAVGPNYKRPTVNVPTDYRDSMAAETAAASSLGNEKWWDVYQDPVLTQLIHTAIQQNYDVRIAATRVLEAQAQLGITRASQFPAAQVLANETKYFSAELNLVEAQLNERLALVQLYQSLGGGWQR